MGFQHTVAAAIVAMAIPVAFTATSSASVVFPVVMEPSKADIDTLIATLKAKLADAETEAEASSIIADVTGGMDIDVVAAALQQLAAASGFSGPVVAALASANTSAQLALSSSEQGSGTGSTGSTSPNGPTVSPFSGSTGSGVPGGGGGSGYPEG